MMNSLKDIIERCHQRHKKPLRQRKTVATHWLYNKDYPNQYTVYCAHKYPVTLSDLEQADISFKPIRRAPGHDRGPGTFNSKKRFLESSGMKNWKPDTGGNRGVCRCIQVSPQNVMVPDGTI